MILKSYIVEKNLKILEDYQSIILYGENEGIKDDIKSQLKNRAKDAEVINIFQDELQKNNDGWQKLITSIRRQIQKSKELQSQMTEALPSVKAEFTHFFREEEIYHWFFLCLWSHEETGRFLTTANQIIFPAIHREIQMKEHVPLLETEEVNDED